MKRVIDKLPQAFVFFSFDFFSENSCRKPYLLSFKSTALNSLRSLVLKAAKSGGFFLYVRRSS